MRRREAGSARPPHQDGPATEQDIAPLWEDLAGEDARKAWRAHWTLVAHPERAVPLLRRVLRPTPPFDAKQLEKEIADLDHEEFDRRERAQARLARQGAVIRPALEKTLAGSPSAEVRRRVTALLDAVKESPLSAEELRAVRAVEILERIATPDAREVLKHLSEGNAERTSTREAKAALARLANRPSLKPLITRPPVCQGATWQGIATPTSFSR